MQQNNSLPDFYTIEDTEDILDFSVPELGIPLWLYLRVPFFHNFPEKWSVHETTFPRFPTKRTFLRFLPDLLSPWPKRDIWFVSDLPAWYYKKQNNVFYDSYFDPLLDIFPSQSLYISRNIYASKAIRKQHLSYKFIQSANLLCQKFSTRYLSSACCRAADQLMDYVQQRTQTLFGISLPPERRKALHDRLLRQVGYELAQYQFYKLLFKYRKPKILFTSNPLLGECSLIVLAREHGITTIEFQHGASGQLAPGYNWAAALCHSPKVQPCVVDYFLTYGTFWHNRHSLPSVLYPVGNPWFSIQSQRYGDNGRGILFCLSTTFDAYPQLIRNVAAAFPDRKVIVRPHPNYRQAFQASEIAKLPGIYVDEETNVYATLSKAEIVIGDQSTSMMEALALGKRVYSMQSTISKDYFSDLDVSFFRDANDLVNLINDETSGKIPQHQREALFCMNWEKNYTDFINQLLAK